MMIVVITMVKFVMTEMEVRCEGVVELGNSGYLSEGRNGVRGYGTAT
jgi:hypothetical protein